MIRLVKSSQSSIHPFHRCPFQDKVIEDKVDRCWRYRPLDLTREGKGREGKKLAR